MRDSLVRAARIELALQAWEAHVLPIYYARVLKEGLGNLREAGLASQLDSKV